MCNIIVFVPYHHQGHHQGHHRGDRLVSLTIRLDLFCLQLQCFRICRVSFWLVWYNLICFCHLGWVDHTGAKSEQIQPKDEITFCSHWIGNSLRSWSTTACYSQASFESKLKYQIYWTTYLTKHEVWLNHKFFG